MRRPPINITPLGRVRRITLGEIAAVIALILMRVGGRSILTAGLEVLLLIFAFDLMTTGTFGHSRLHATFEQLRPLLSRPCRWSTSYHAARRHLNKRNATHERGGCDAHPESITRSRI